MVKKVLLSAANNLKRVFIVWLVIILANQLIIFSACFAPHCLAAALPHTLAIALLVNFFGFGNNNGTESFSASPVRSAEGPAASCQAAACSPDSTRSKEYSSRIRLAALFWLAVAGIIFAIYLSKSESSQYQPPSTATESITDINPKYEELEEEMPDERAPSRDLIPKDPVSLASDAGAGQESASNNSNALGRAAQSYYDDDEFDVNDIEQYERLNSRKYRSATANALNEAYSEDDEFDVNDIEQRERLAKIRASQTKTDLERQEPIEHAYRCATSSGKSGIGTGRLSQENEYSSFLNKGVQAGEFVIFKYQNSSKEYWFRHSNCIRL